MVTFEDLTPFCLLFLALNHSKAGNELGLGVELVLGLGIRSGIVLGGKVRVRVSVRDRDVLGLHIYSPIENLLWRNFREIRVRLHLENYQKLLVFRHMKTPFV